MKFTVSIITVNKNNDKGLFKTIESVKDLVVFFLVNILLVGTCLFLDHYIGSYL